MFFLVVPNCLQIFQSSLVNKLSYGYSQISNNFMIVQTVDFYIYFLYIYTLNIIIVTYNRRKRFERNFFIKIISIAIVIIIVKRRNYNMDQKQYLSS